LTLTPKTDPDFREEVNCKDQLYPTYGLEPVFNIKKYSSSPVQSVLFMASISIYRLSAAFFTWQAAQGNSLYKRVDPALQWDLNQHASANPVACHAVSERN